ncbi:MAG: N-acetyltransferase family protein, partial [Thermoplasmata archaeon]
MATLKILIREARIGDLGDITDLWEQMAEHHSRLSHHFTLAEDGKDKYSKYLARKFSEKSTKLVVATSGPKVVGFMLCLLSPNTPVFRERTVGVVSDVYVRPEFRMKGVAREMLKSGLRWFHKNKVSSVQLSVAAENFAARSAWGQLGFKPHMIMKRLDLDKYPATRMLSEEPKVVRKKVVWRAVIGWNGRVVVGA